MERNKFKYMLLILIGATSYGVLATVAKLTYKQGSTLGEISFLQVFVGVIMLWAIVFIGKKDKIKKKISKKDILYLLLGGIPTGATTIFYYKAIQEIPASMAVLLLFQFTWLGIFIDCILEKKKPSKIQLISIVVLIVGTLFSSNVLANGIDRLTVSGIIFGLLSAVSYTLFTILNGKISLTVNSKKRSALMLSGSLMFITIIYPPTFIANIHVVFPLLKYIVIMALLGVVIPPLCFSIAVPKIGVSLTSILSSIELPSAILVSVLILHEKVILIQWVGVLIIIGGIILPVIFSKKKN